MSKRHIKPLTEVQKAYLAGFFDGEGCIHIGKHQSKNTPTPIYNLYVIVAQTNKAIIDDMLEMVGLGSVHLYKRSLKNKNENDAYAWRLSGRHAADFLTAIKDYVKLKRFQLDVALEFHTTRNFQKYHHGRGSKVPTEIIERREQLAQMLKSYKKTQYSNTNTVCVESEKKPEIQRKLL